MTCTKGDLNSFQSRNTKTECSTSGWMVLATITRPREEKFFVNEINTTMEYRSVHKLKNLSLRSRLGLINVFMTLKTDSRPKVKRKKR